MARAVKIMTIAATLLFCLDLGMRSHELSRAAAESETGTVRLTSDSAKEGQAPPNATRAAREEKALQDARRQQLSE